MSLCASTLRKSFGSSSLLRQQQHLRHIPMNRAQQQQHALFFTQTSSSNHTTTPTVHNTHQYNNNNHNNNHNNQNNNNKRRGWWYKTSVGSALLVSTYLVSTTCMDWYNDCVIGRRNTIHIHDESFMKSTIESISEKYRFCPTWYLHNTHLQTIVNALGRQLHMNFSIDRQQFKFSTPGDGDDDEEEYYVYLDYIYNNDDDKKQQQQQKNKRKNILLIIPGVFAGTEGVSVKQFIQHASSAEEGNYQCVVLNFTCENGQQMGHRNIIPGLPPRPPIHNNQNNNNNQNKSKNVNRDEGDCTTDLLVHSIVQHLYQQLHDTSDDVSDDERTESKSSSSLVVMGISLGSNILCNYLSRFPQQSAQMIDAAVALANPFDLVNTTRNLSSSTSSSSSLLVNHSSNHVNNNSSSTNDDENHHEKWWWWWFNMKSKMNQFYDRQLLIKRKMMMQQNLHHYILPDSLLYREMMDELNHVESTREFDLKYTLPLFSLASGERQQDEQQQEGYKREQELDHYYASQSSKHQIHKVQVPLLCIHAKDDRISLMENAPIDAVQENHNLAFLCTDYGGHVGWLSGWTPLSSKEPSWMETVVVEYLNRMTNKRSDNRA